MSSESLRACLNTSRRSTGEAIEELIMCLGPGRFVIGLVVFATVSVIQAVRVAKRKENGTRRVLAAAAFTYIAVALTALFTLPYLLLISKE
jgi:Putative neutral zinc metallopeptidase